MLPPHQFSAAVSKQTLLRTALERGSLRGLERLLFLTEPHGVHGEKTRYALCGSVREKNAVRRAVGEACVLSQRVTEHTEKDPLCSLWLRARKKCCPPGCREACVLSLSVTEHTEKN